MEADDQVYALIDARRDELFAAEAGFRIEPPEDSLREQILDGRVQELPPLALLEFLDIAAENNREYQDRKESSIWWPWT